VNIGIGNTLREARNRRKIDLSEAENATKIRARYLRAMENEEWDVLPGGAYTRAFVRTYANYLGLDGERLAEEYKREAAPSGGERAARVEPVASAERRGRRISGRVWAVAVVLAVVALLVGIGLVSGGDDGVEIKGARSPEKGRGATKQQAKPAEATVEVTATAEVWVCMLDDLGEPVIDGEILEAGAEAGPFRSKSFTAAFGNGEFELTIDGEPVDTPSSSSPVGYEIDARGDITPLEEGERPDCA
jgi:hypothetical protein